EKIVDTSDEWIVSRSGISERRIISEDETTSTIAAAAARQAMERAGVGAQDIDLIILATITGDYPNVPASASLVQNILGIKCCGAFDLVAGCSGFVCGLVTGSQFIQNGACRNVLVIGAESMTRVLDWTDRTTCVLFGDGAGAVVLRPTEKEGGLLSFVLGSDGAGAEHLIIPAGGTKAPATHDTVERRQHYVKMNGKEVFKFASRILPRAFHQTLEKAGIRPEEVSLLVPHQANIRIIESARQNLAVPEDAIYVNVNRYGNTSSASIPVALCEAIEEGRLKPGSILAMVAFGAGLTWGSVAWRWQG
ncbi:MAG TPA: beta-ketoacyl-ACP synthase III, partial [Chloroflexota bacterium]|nr:beta-ketoacyl-ACP synthase III [Chloroflexota bacterium]